MKFYTKEWNSLMQHMHYTLGIKPIADKQYSDEEIAELYKKKLKAAIALDRREYNTPPRFLEVDFDDVNLDELAYLDVATGTLKRPESIEEAKRALEEEQAREEAAFAKRPPFDPGITKKMFETAYDNALKRGYSSFPDWVKDKVDIRLIALNCLPKSVYDRLSAEQKQSGAEFRKIMRAARKAFEKESANIPERILNNFSFHDAAVLSLEQTGDDCVMALTPVGIPFDGGEPQVRVTFVDGKVIECDEEIGKGDMYWLYDELYKTENGYEAHMLLQGEGLCYLTIACSDIIIEESISKD